MLTLNEKRVLRFLAVNVRNDHSINEVARECGLTPRGAYKLLTKFENEGILQSRRIANIKSYTLNFGDEKTRRVLELAYIPEGISGRVKIRSDDLRSLKQVTSACILFGSYITVKAEPRDLDVLFVVDRKHFAEYKKILARVQDITPLKIQDVVQTPDDLERNLKKGDSIVQGAMRHGIVLWGFDAIVEAVKDVGKRQTEEVF